jgi:hypothetical protein
MTAPNAQARPFTFDTVIVAPRPKRAFTPDEVEAVRTDAFAAGERSALARAEAHAAAALAQAAAVAREALGALTHLAHEHRIAAAELALAAARKIAGAALDAFPEAPAAAALTALARELESTPRLLVHSPTGRSRHGPCGVRVRLGRRQGVLRSRGGLGAGGGGLEQRLDRRRAARPTPASHHPGPGGLK